MMEKMNETKREAYTPSPVDTSHVVLSEELMGLTEELARNVHEVWSAGRIAEGWRWGPERDDVLKENPCLVPYDELPEREKVYDRKTSVETLKLIVALGYTIERRC